MYMANPRSTNTRELVAFNRLNAPERLAVEMKARGSSINSICLAMKSEYGFERGYEAVRDWFRADSGRLVLALDQFSQFIAFEELKEAKMMMARLLLPAVVTLAKLMNTGSPSVQLRAAKTILDLTMPDATVVSRPGKRLAMLGESGLPDELQERDEWSELVQQASVPVRRYVMQNTSKMERDIENMITTGDVPKWVSDALGHHTENPVLPRI